MTAGKPNQIKTTKRIGEMAYQQKILLCKIDLTIKKNTNRMLKAALTVKLVLKIVEKCRLCMLTVLCIVEAALGIPGVGSSSCTSRTLFTIS